MARVRKNITPVLNTTEMLYLCEKGYLDSYQLKEHVNLRTYIYHLEQKNPTK